METIFNLSSIIAAATAFSVIVGAYVKVRMVQRDTKRDKEYERASIVQESKEADSRLKLELGSRIQALETRLDNLEESVAKDFAHVKETMQGEIRNLGDKIEDLRTELRGQHGQLVGLLGKMIENNK